MSHEATLWAWEQELPSVYSMTILLYLSNCHDEVTNRCSPSIPKISEKCKISESSVKKYIDELEKIGLISRKHRSRNGRRISSEVILHFNKGIGRQTAFIKAVSQWGKLQLQPILITSSCVSTKHIDSHRGRLTRMSRWEPEKDYDNAPALSPNFHRRNQKVDVKEKIRTTQPTDEELSILDYWNTIAVHHKPGSIKYGSCILAIRNTLQGTIFVGKQGLDDHVRPYAKDHIITALKKFNVRRNNSAYYPRNKKWLRSLSLNTFFYNDRGYNNGNGNGSATGSSQFLQCYTDELRLIADQVPELTDFLIAEHLEKTGNTLRYVEASRASGKLAGYWKENEDWLKENGVPNEMRLIAQWMEMLCDRYTEWDVGKIISRNMNPVFFRFIENR